MRRGLVRGVTCGLVLAAQCMTAAVAAEPATTPAPIVRARGADRVATAIAVNALSFGSADTVVLARADQFADALAAGPLAAALRAPLLLTPGDALAGAVAAELDRLGATTVVLLGGEDALSAQVATTLADAGRTVHRLAGPDREATARVVAAAAVRAWAGQDPYALREAPDPEDVDTVWVASSRAFPDALAAGPVAARGRDPLLLTRPDAASDELVALVEELAPAEVVVVGGTAAVGEAVVAALAGDDRTTTRLRGPDRLATALAVHDRDVERHGAPAELWGASSRDFPDALAATSSAVARRAGLLLLDDGDGARSTLAARRRPDVPVRLLGGTAAVSAAVERELGLAALGRLHPAGGARLFPDHLMVAYYGNARSTRLGVLGETTPEVAAERVTAVADEYAASGRTLLPTFELIVSVAQRSAGSDGDYSAIGPPEDVQRYLDVARAHGIHLVLDLQPGRSDFLSQARVFDAFLAQPDVHLALDPEWRMGPNERPGQTIGSVGAAEVQRVLDHVAAIVRENDLPQKLVVLHQFRTSMVRDRATLRVPAEVALLVHVDGFGSRAAKLNTYAALTGPDDPFAHGFKLFYDEDTNLFAPADVLAIRPTVDFVSYQ